MGAWEGAKRHEAPLLKMCGITRESIFFQRFPHEKPTACNGLCFPKPDFTSPLPTTTLRLGYTNGFWQDPGVEVEVGDVPDTAQNSDGDC